MGLQDQRSGDIRATLAVSQEEARFGSSRVINLPGGRTMTVVVPAGTYDGQELRLAGQGSARGSGGLPGDLILRVSVIVSEGQRVGDDFATERALYTSPSDSTPAGAEPRPGWLASAPPAQGPSFASAPIGGASGSPPAQPQSSGPQPYPAYGAYQNNPASAPMTPPLEQSYPVYGQAAAPPSKQPYPAYGGYQDNPAYGQSAPPTYPPQPVQSPKPRRSGAITALILVIVLVVIAGSGLAFYLGYYQPNQAHTVATQTAQAQISATAHAGSTSTAQVVQGTANTLATSTAQVQATVQAYQSIYTHATSGTPVLDDSLSGPALTSLWDITIGSAANGACSFTGGSYHSTIPTANFFEPCYALNTNYSNFAFQVDMTITQGDFGGVLLRANGTHNKFYLFRIGVDGSFALYNYSNTQGSQALLLLTGTAKSIKGLNQSNEITAIAQHSTMYFFLNRQYLGSINDSSYSAGQIGVFAESEKNPTDAAFSHAKVWTL